MNVISDIYIYVLLSYHHSGVPLTVPTVYFDNCVYSSLTCMWYNSSVKYFNKKIFQQMSLCYMSLLFHPFSPLLLKCIWILSYINFSLKISHIFLTYTCTSNIMNEFQKKKIDCDKYLMSQDAFSFNFLPLNLILT